MAKENVNKYFELFKLFESSIQSENYTVLDVLRASELLCAQCVACANVNREVEEKTFVAIADDIRNFTQTFKSMDGDNTSAKVVKLTQ